jgi:YcxB-like protein
MAKVPVNKHQPMYQMPSSPLAVKTKKFSLDKKAYVNISMRQLVKAQKQWALLPLGLLLVNAILGITGIYPNYWVYIVVILGALLYVGFWWVQFTGVTQLEQYKQLFDKFMYEIDSRQILVKTSAKEGGVLQWDQIKEAEKHKDAYLLIVARGQFLHFPFNVFNSEHDQKLFERILKQKNLIPATESVEKK